MADFSPWMPMQTSGVPSMDEQLKLAMLQQQDPKRAFLYADPLGTAKPLAQTQAVDQGPIEQPKPSIPKPPAMPPQVHAPRSAMSPEDVAMMDQYKNLLSDRQGRIGQANQNMQDLGEAPTGLMGANLMPLAGLVDSWTGSNLKAGYQGPQAKQEYDKKKQILQAALDKERNGLTDDQFAYLKMKADQATKADHMDMQRQLLAVNMRRGDQRYELGDYRKHDENLKMLNNNKSLTDVSLSANNLQFAINNFSTGSATPESFHELQQAVRANLGIKGTSTGNERSETFMKSAGITKDKWVQFMTGNPQSVMDSDPAFAHHVLNLARMELKNKMVQGNKLVDQLTSGHKSYYSAPHRSEMANDYNANIEQARQRFVLPDVSGHGSTVAKAPLSRDEFMRLTPEERKKLVQGGM